eukprot:g1599.t1
MEDSKQSEDAKTVDEFVKLQNEARIANFITTKQPEEDEVQSPPQPTPLSAATPSGVHEDPAVEGLLLLQHSSQSGRLGAHPDEKTEDSTGIIKLTTASMRDGALSEESNSNRNDFDERINPLQKLVLEGIDGLELCVQNAFLEHYRGVFCLEKKQLYYALISYNEVFHFLGFYTTATAAARAWDLAALKRSMDTGKNLSMARTNFSFNRYIQLENIFGLLLVFTFSALVDLLKSFTPPSLVTGSSSDVEDVNRQIQICSEAFINEEGNVSISSELREAILSTTKTNSKIETFTPDQLRTILTKSCSEETVTQGNEWVKTIRDNSSWKGVYFTRDGSPYSKVEIEGKYHYLGKFETIEGAARAYDLATLKRAMINNQSLVSLNFSTEDYIKHEQLMSFLYFADTDQVTGFIRMISQSNKTSAATSTSPVNYTSSVSGDSSEHKANKRMKLETPVPMTCLNSWGFTPRTTSVQHIDWASLGLGLAAKKTMTHHKNQGPSKSTPSFPSKTLDSPMESGRDMEIGDEVFIEGPTSRKHEFRAERRICDEKMATALRDSTGWTRVARNAVALKMTNNTLQIANQQYTSFPQEITEWITPSTGDIEGQQHIVELLDPFRKQSFHMTCYMAADGTYTFLTSSWNEFIEDIGLTLGDILVLLDRKTSWKLSYAVFILSDAVLPSGVAPNQDPGLPMEQGGARSAGMVFCPTASSPSPLLKAVPMGPAPVKLTQMLPTPNRRTLQAHVLPTAQNLTNIRVIQKVQDGRLLVQASLASFPSSQGLFIIPANSIQSWPRNFLNGQPVNYGPMSPGSATQSKRIPANPQTRVMTMSSRVSSGGGGSGGGAPTTRVHAPANFHLQPHPACLPAAPIQLNIRGGFQALAKKNDVNLYMVADSNGQMRLLTSQPGASANHMAPFRQSMDITSGQQGVIGPNLRVPVSGGGVNEVDSPEIMTLTSTSTASETSEPRVGEFSVTMDKDRNMERTNETEEGKVEVNSQPLSVGATTGGGDSGKKEAESGEDPEENNLTSMHTQMKRILEKCQGLNSDLAKQYRFVFANKMNAGQRVANFMEIKTMSEAGEWREVIEWIERTLESL